MEPITIIIQALKIEAKMKPDARIYVGTTTYTYREFADMLDQYPGVNNHFVKTFLSSAVNLYNSNNAFKRRMISLAKEG